MGYANTPGPKSWQLEACPGSLFSDSFIAMVQTQPPQTHTRSSCTGPKATQGLALHLEHSSVHGSGSLGEQQGSAKGQRQQPRAWTADVRVSALFCLDPGHMPGGQPQSACHLGSSFHMLQAGVRTENDLAIQMPGWGRAFIEPLSSLPRPLYARRASKALLNAHLRTTKVKRAQSAVAGRSLREGGYPLQHSQRHRKGAPQQMTDL